MKCLVTGSAGLIGNTLVFDLEKSGYTVISCYNNTKPQYGIPTKLNLLNIDDISKTFKKFQPDIIIHLAALTDVEKCEVDKQLASLINEKSTETIAKEAEKLKSFLIYISTDYVFDGIKGDYTETDFPNPLNHYGKTKLAGEKIVKNINTKWSVIRTSTPFGINSYKKSFPDWIVDNLQKNKKLNILDDQITSPTYVPNLSKMILEIITRKLEGFFHLSGSTRISRFEFAKKIVKNLNLDNSLLNPVKLATMPWKSKRPFDSSLDVSKANSILTTKPFSIEDSLDEYISKLQNSFSL